MFITNFIVPFDNNMAERELRNIKAKTNVSGTFRSPKGAEHYLKVMSYISTARKNGVNAIKAVTGAFDGNPDVILVRSSE